MHFDLDVFRNYDLRVTGIEVTQGNQAQRGPCGQSNSQCAVVPSLPAVEPVQPGGAVPYQGVRLVRLEDTVARAVFANTTQAGGRPGRRHRPSNT